MEIKNPIIPGFFPDPSIVRTGDDYFIVNSSFEWFPGVPVHHSRDLANWELSGHILTDEKLLDLRGVADSAGVWAPSLSYADGLFWLIYTNVHTCGAGRPYKDINIYLTTSTDINGPWSEPVRLNSIGFDPSLFHDDDGRKWLANMVWDFRKDKYSFAGIVIQEYDHLNKKLIGSTYEIMKKENILCEGPNIYKHNGWYYLMMAEGGTGWNHGISMARSRNLTGPYELDPEEAVITSRHSEKLELQKAGHGELVETQSGEWYMAHLASRPVVANGKRYCTLGRETCLQKVVWSDDGWLRLADGGSTPSLTSPAPVGLKAEEPEHVKKLDNFDGLKLDPDWCSLRGPVDSSWLSLEERPGYLRLYGRQSQISVFEQSMIAKRVQNFKLKVETCVEFEPEHFTQMAGLICYYDTRTHYYLRITHDENYGKVVGVILNDDTVYDELNDSQVVINDWEKVYLKAEIDRKNLQFYVSKDGKVWVPVGPVMDMYKLSDDYGNYLHFTGAMAGICAQDLGGAGSHADFSYFLMDNY